MSHVIIYSSTSTEGEAEKIVDALVEKKFAAGASIQPNIQSTYRWKGKVCKANETLLMIITKQERVEDVKNELRKHHSYECPGFIVVPIIDGSADYLKWIDDNT